MYVMCGINETLADDVSYDCKTKWCIKCNYYPMYLCKTERVPKYIKDWLDYVAQLMVERFKLTEDLDKEFRDLDKFPGPKYKLYKQLEMYPLVKQRQGGLMNLLAKMEVAIKKYRITGRRWWVYDIDWTAIKKTFPKQRLEEEEWVWNGKFNPIQWIGDIHLSFYLCPTCMRKSVAIEHVHVD